MQLGSAVSLVVSDVDADPGGLQPLESVTLTATPLIDVLQERERQETDIKVVSDDYARPKSNERTPSHLAQVNDEAVPLVEAAPGHLHLRRSDGPPTLNMQQALHVHVVCHHMLKT